MNIILSENETMEVQQQQIIKGGAVCRPQEDKRRERPGTSPTTSRSSKNKS